MSTRSLIIAKLGEKSYRGIYCHFDGYPERVGQILLEHYSEQEKIEALLALGDLSRLGAKLEPTGPHSYDHPEPECTVAYRRDRGEDGAEPTDSFSVAAICAAWDMNRHVYVWDGASWTHDGEDLAECIRSASARDASKGDV